ncbi:MAG TPA: FmdB family zinc ribbon protein [Anaerolineae bacterium]|nr:FmdB family zinc ribbon protein [Anaerolineae bacterium]
MPLYTYKCEDCEHVFETRQRMTDDPLTDCPNCDGSIRRVVNAVGIVFKGSGFYVTDTRNGSSAVTATSGKSDKSETSSSSSSSSSSSEAKPATGGESKSSDSKPAKSSD